MYGSQYSIQNGYGNWAGGYLDVNGSGCDGNVLCVSTSTLVDRDQGSGTWVIESVNPGLNGTPVRCNDKIYLRNIYGGGGTYLDVRNNAATCPQNLFNVSTASGSDRDSGSGTWIIMPQTCGPTGTVEANVPVHLINCYANGNGGFLDVCGSGCAGDLYCVSTSGQFNRDAGSSLWRLNPSS